MKKIIKKAAALVLVFGLLVVPVKPAAAFDFGGAANRIEQITPGVVGALNMFGYSDFALLVNKWAPIITSFLKSFGKASDAYNQPNFAANAF